jgi:hypothetical protein
MEDDIVRKYIIGLFLLFFLLVFPLDINASLCDFNELAKYKNIANNVDMFYYFDDSDESIKFNIIFNNLRDGMYIEDYTNNKIYEYDESSLFIQGFEDGKRHRFDFYISETNCSNNLLITLYADLPKYNPFYKEEVCDLSISICDKWSNHGLGKEAFIKKVEELKKTDNSNEKPDEKEEYYSWFFEMYEAYYLYLYLFIIISASTTIYYLNKKDDFDLETN